MEILQLVSTEIEYRPILTNHKKQYFSHEKSIFHFTD